MSLLEKIFGSANDREVKSIMKTVEEIEALEPTIKALSDDALREKTLAFKDRIEKGESLDDLLVEAFAVVREAAVRTVGLRHFKVQLLGGIVLHQGRIAEMKTGEGKTLAATLPAYLNALSGKGVHIVTVNDYLAYRDKEWMGKIFEFLGLTVGNVIHGVQGPDRVKAYQADITYGTNNEFGFDYLRDNMALYAKDRVQRPLNYAIIDEVDSILIDEARTPLIISGSGTKSTEGYGLAQHFAASLKEEDVSIDEKGKSVVLTDETGIPKAEKFYNISNLSDPENMEISHHINQALKANFIMKKDVDYVVKDGEVVIVDEFTGRLMFGRRYSAGLHQAIEAKENIKVRRESQTLATITLQNYFRMYNKLSGMTGTALTEEDEFRHIYNMDVVVIPTNKPIVRDDMADVVYRNLKGKFLHVLEDIKRCHEKGQPVLVGTISIETSEFLGKLLKKHGIKHEILNAKQHHREAEIVAQAGRYGAVTIATNMAGRGTDIVLGGNPEYMAKKDLLKEGYSEHVINLASSPLPTEDPEVLACREKFEALIIEHKKVTDVEAVQVKEAGGLHIIGTERHESRRIDNQLRGRAGRQGDPGSTQFFLSLEDDLLRLFMGDNVKAMLDRLGMDENMPIEAKMLTRSIEGAQKKVEGRNFSARKHVLQYDDVMNKQREIIYQERNRVLDGENLREHIWKMVVDVVTSIIEEHSAHSPYPEEWDYQAMYDQLHAIFLNKNLFDQIENKEEVDKQDLIDMVLAEANLDYEKKEEILTQDRLREIERIILLKVVDTHWIDHIDAMDQLKQGISLRAIGQQNPVQAYQIEGFNMFGQMIESIKRETVRFIYGAQVETSTKREQVAKEEAAGGPQAVSTVNREKKVGRNDPCPCGSGLKYKKCHGKNA